MSESFELDPVEWITAGAVGEPGRRSFYIQARQGAELVVLAVEKAQVQALAQLAQELLARLDVTVLPDDLDAGAHRPLDPVVAAWRVGVMSLGMDEGGVRFLLEAEELVVEDQTWDPATARFWLDRDQLVALAAYAAFAVEAGARERCRLCSRPIDPDGSHVCPSSNGHGPLTA